MKIRDPMSNKLLVKTLTWKPDDKMNPRQAEREAIIKADAFEEEVKGLLTGSISGTDSYDMTLYNYSVDWLAKRNGDIALSTLSHYEGMLKIMKEVIGNVKVRQITPYIIQSFFNYMDNMMQTKYKITAKPMLIATLSGRMTSFARDNGIAESSVRSAMHGRNVALKSAKRMSECLNIKLADIFEIEKTELPYAYETIHKHKRCIRAILATAKKQRLIQDNFASSDYITFGKRPEQDIEFMDDITAKKFYNHVATNIDITKQAVMMTLLLTGLRRGELCGLNWSDIDLEKKKMKIRKSYTVVYGHGLILKDPKTDKSTRTMTLPQILVDKLASYKMEWDKKKELLGDRVEDGDSVFITKTGKRMHPSTINKWLSDILDDIGEQHMTVHSLRHTNITMQIIAGVPISIVAGRAGHARTSTTLDIYAHVISTADQEAADKLNNMFA